MVGKDFLSRVKKKKKSSIFFWSTRFRVMGGIMLTLWLPLWAMIWDYRGWGKHYINCFYPSRCRKKCMYLGHVRNVTSFHVLVCSHPLHCVQDLWKGHLLTVCVSIGEDKSRGLFLEDQVSCSFLSCDSSLLFPSLELKPWKSIFITAVVLIHTYLCICISQKLVWLLPLHFLLSKEKKKEKIRKWL